MDKYNMKTIITIILALSITCITLAEQPLNKQQIAAQRLADQVIRESAQNKQNKPNKNDNVVRIPINQNNNQQQLPPLEQLEGIPSPLNFSETLSVVVAVGLPNLTDAQQVAFANFIGDGTDTNPRVKALATAVMLKMKRDGVIPPNTELGAINWQNSLIYIQGLLPVIEMIIK